jgi:hypothetical protein
MKNRDLRRDRMKASEMRKNRVHHEMEGGRDDGHAWKKDRRKQREFKRMVLMLCLPLLLVAGACGGASDAGEDTAGQARSNGAPKKGEDEQRKFLAFAKCMREQGIDMPDPEFKGSGEIAAVRIGGPDVSPQEMEEAQKACRKYLPDAATGEAPKLSEEDQDAFLAFARCMRQNGVDVPDPRPGDGGLVFRVGDKNAVNPESAEYREAEKSCRKHLTLLDRKIDRERT